MNRKLDVVSLETQETTRQQSTDNYTSNFLFVHSFIGTFNNFNVSHFKDKNYSKVLTLGYFSEVLNKIGMKK